ncbi:MAG: hypothetical protein KZQ58_05275 [gamma proteobacterium symbiont of Bathyaustriella thionipta]|nr:hypothetical protein [gamma proteobacterium symbiont of Bathyaustriella thionipta]
MLDKGLRLLLRHNIATLVFLLLIIGLLAAGIRQLTFSSDYQVFFDNDNPELQAFYALQETYSKTDNVLFVVAADKGNVFSRTTLSAIEELTRQAWQIPHSLRVDSLTN